MNTTIKELNIENLEHVQNLQKKIIANLHADERHFILERSADDFLKALSSEKTHMLGVFDQEKLIAQCLFSFPEDGKERDMSEFAGNISNSDLVIYKSILVDPQYRGSNLMHKMLEYIEAKAIKMGKKNSIIQIAVDNPASWINALKHGMSIRKVDEDPYDQAKVIYLQKEITNPKKYENAQGQKFHMSIGQDIHREIPALFNRMQYRIEQGYHGVKLEKAGGVFKMVWSKQEEPSNTNVLKRNMLQQKLGMRTIT